MRATIDSLTGVMEKQVTREYQFNKNKWYCSLYNMTGKTRKFIRTRNVKSSKITQTFYTYRNQLIFATETIIYLYTTNNKADSSIWQGKFYFDNEKLIDMESLGHGKSEDDNWDPEKEVLQNYAEAKDWSKRAQNSMIGKAYE